MQMATQSDCAIHFFISLPRLRDLIDTGVITRQQPNCYDLNEVRREVLTNLRAKAAARDGGENLAHERALLAKSQRELAETKAAQLRGAVVEIEEVCFQLENRYALVKERLLSIPGKIADELAHRDRADIVGILRREVVEALDELSTPARIIEEAGGRPDNLGQADPPI
jgi:phage terminase Nu1 subunit (DNA packaging protein)